ncbi:biopolymer transporter ExbD [Zooshikella marina]|uniref:Biopolymer transporter ExbD n=1 Tax=Zooshikella ganghwensis TaxID=202772 RepID=A0A4P9VLJ5_9GAMM|nr:biopolymer transporter ExbD [Zooshikella ganghwensis]MBU2707493.1 biopolymer transporter ExbD [Zooshikella ganghwensis]RDH42732.1 biopolymer transporter ExbD [Zooshikella ganghwensis]
MRVNRHVSSDADESGIDLTPMLDVVFIMLIFFIVTSSFVRESGVTVSRPEAQTAQAQPAGAILVAIKPSGDIWIDKRQVDIRRVRAHIERLKAEIPEVSAVIQADRDARTGILINVMDQIKLAGISQIAVATVQP